MVYEFEHYLKKRVVKKSTPNKAEAKALLNRAKHRLDYVETQDITQDNALFIFEDVYEAIREAVQSLMSLKGFKPYSHEALVAFLTKILCKNLHRSAN